MYSENGELQTRRERGGYTEALKTLNSLQSIAEARAEALSDPDAYRSRNVPRTIECCKIVGVSLDDVDKLNVIHISGTKGKGSTSAFCERLLREHGYKTGMFISPHLVEERERIRLNGRPLSREKFTSYFWDCYEKLEAKKEDLGGEMPGFFKVLAIMAFHVFREEKVNVAIIEVGVGGEYDSTNIFRNPVVCGVTSLGYDHTSILGDTLSSIAWHKAGIFKSGAPALTSPQLEEAMSALIDRAKERQCELRVAPALVEYDWGGKSIDLGIKGKVQALNASLALQIVHTWMQNHRKGINERKEMISSERGELKVADTFPITKEMAAALRNTHWSGRSQTIEKDGLTYYVDGAHTPASLKNCAEWFNEASDVERKRLGNKKVIRVLLFNMTGDRKPASLLLPLLDCAFDCAVFCPNITTVSKDQAGDPNFLAAADSQRSQCMINRNAWLEATSIQFSYSPENSSKVVNDFLKSSDPDDEHTKTKVHHREKSLASLPLSAQKIMPTFVFDSISEALLWASKDRMVMASIDKEVLPPITDNLQNVAHVQILVTGSMHLVGGVFKIIKPDIND